MVWDLGEAMRKKENFESARLIDFEFRQRCRAFKMLAEKFGLDKAVIVGELALHKERDILARVAQRSYQGLHDVEAVYLECLTDARKQLIAERGDPTPIRLG